MSSPTSARSCRRAILHFRPAGRRDRRHRRSSHVDLLDTFGFDTVDAGPLKEGWRIQRDTPGYGPRRTAEELRRDRRSCYAAEQPPTCAANPIVTAAIS